MQAEKPALTFQAQCDQNVSNISLLTYFNVKYNFFFPNTLGTNKNVHAAMPFKSKAFFFLTTVLLESFRGLFVVRCGERTVECVCD